MSDRCRHCHGIIASINFALGEKWMHVDPNASFPTTAKGTAWLHCRLQVAEPEPVEKRMQSQAFKDQQRRGY